MLYVLYLDPHTNLISNIHHVFFNHIQPPLLRMTTWYFSIYIAYEHNFSFTIDGFPDMSHSIFVPFTNLPILYILLYKYFSCSILLSLLSTPAIVALVQLPYNATSSQKYVQYRIYFYFFNNVFDLK